LSVLTIVGGFVETPASLGHITAFSDLMSAALPAAVTADGGAAEILLEIAAAAASLAGIAVSYWLFFPRGARVATRRAEAAGARAPWPAALDRLWASGWGFDRIYDALFVRPFMTIAAALRRDPIDDAYS